MSTRLQVILDDEEMREIKRLAGSQHLTVAGWVREALRAARQRQPETSADKKIQSIRAAVRHTFPTADIAGMLAEIEAGYTHDDKP